MARGKPSLATTVNSDEIVYSGEELGSIPNFLLKDENGAETIGIVVDQYGYNIAILKDAYKKGKDEDNNNIVIHYKKWDEIKYFSEIIEQSIKGNAELIKQKEELKHQIRLLKEEVEELAPAVEEIKKAIRNMKKASKYTQMEEEE